MPPHELHPVPPTGTFTKEGLSPFGIGVRKPKHFRDMASVIWKNRDNLGYAWQVISKGVCDGCALGVAGLHDWTIDGVHLCMTRLNLLRLNTVGPFDPAILADVKSLDAMDNQQLRDLGRIPYPMIREAGAPGFRRLSWDEALDYIAAEIHASTPDRLALFVTARGVTNEVYYVAQKAARYIGTPHVDNAARICHSPSTAAMKRTLGVAASTCSYKDWYGTDLIVFFGSNPANDQPVSTKYLLEAKQLGTKIVMVNPYMEPGMRRYWVPSNAASAVFGTDLADHWFPVSQGGDIAFLSGVLKILIETDRIDHSFIREHTEGLDSLHASLQAMTFEELEKQSGLPLASMHGFADLIANARTGVLIWSMGITQHAFGADAVQAILNLGLLRGWLGRDQCGLMPIRGHSSVQGGAEMGAYATALPGAIPITPESAEHLSQQYGFPIPARVGFTATEMVEAAYRGQIDILYSLGGNFLRNLPEPDRVREALERAPIRIHQDIILTDQMFIPAQKAVILLPAKTRYEQDGGGIETTTERRVCFSPEIPREVGEARAEWDILRSIALRVRPEQAEAFGCATGQAIREEIARVVPFYDGIQHLNKTGDAIQYGGRHLCEGGVTPLPDGRAHFHAVALPDHEVPPGQFKCSTRRGKQFNSLIYAEIDPINGAPRDAVLMNAEDAAEMGLITGDTVRLVNDLGSYEARVHLAPIAPRNLQIHWPEGNILIRKGVVDAGGGVPDYNAFVRIVPDAPGRSSLSAD